MTPWCGQQAALLKKVQSVAEGWNRWGLDILIFLAGFLHWDEQGTDCVCKCKEDRGRKIDKPILLKLLELVLLMRHREGKLANLIFYVSS